MESICVFSEGMEVKAMTPKYNCKEDERNITVKKMRRRSLF